MQHEEDQFHKLLEAQKQELFEHRKYLNKKGDRKRVKISENDQKFRQDAMSKMIAKDLKTEKIVKINKE